MTLPKLTVWYNSKCPVCDAGIGWEKNRLVRAARAGAIEFRDINYEPLALAHLGAGIEDVRRRLHGIDADGRVFIGAACAIAMRLRAHPQSLIARLAGARFLRPVVRFGYDRFADVLYAWNRRKGHW